MTEPAFTLAPDAETTITPGVPDPAEAVATAVAAVAELDPADPIRVAVEALGAAITGTPT